MLSVYMRRDFPSLGLYRSYLNTAYIGLMPRILRDQGVRLLVEYVSDPLTRTLEARELYPRVRRLVAQYVGIEKPDNLTLLAQGTTSCIERTVLSALAELMKEQRQPIPIVATSQEYPGVLLALRSLCRNLKQICKKLEIIGEPGSYKWEHKIIELMEEKGPIIAVVSSIQWITGYRGDIGYVARTARKTGSILVLDGAHHFGHLPIDPRTKMAHAVCGTARKWLLTPIAGLGIAYYSDEFIRRVQPYSYAIHHLTNEIPSFKEFLEGAEPSLLETADRFSALSRPSEFSVEALYETARYLSTSTSIIAVQDHIFGLRKILTDLLEESGFQEALYGEPYERKSGTILVSTGLNKYRESEVAKYLSKVGVSVSFRDQYGIHGIRVSLHLYNNEQDIQVFVEELKRGVERL